MENTFDQKAREWDNDPVKVERAQKVADAMRRQVAFTPGMKAMEYGCGTGLLTFALQDVLTDVTLADSSTGMLEVLKEKIVAAGVEERFKPLQLDLVNDPLPADRFDLLYSLLTLHHIKDTKAVLDAWTAILAPGGYLCIADLESEPGCYRPPDFEGHWGFERTILQKWLEERGFQHVKFEQAASMLRDIDGEQVEFPLFLCCAEKRDI